MFYLEPSLDDVKNLIDVSRGIEPADLYIRGGMVANVYSGEYLRANVAIKKDRIAYVGVSEASVGPNTEVIDASSRYLCPGYIEPHTHACAIYNTVEWCRKVLPLGTTAVFNDSVPYLVLLKDEAFEKILADMSALPVKIFWGPRVVPPSPMADQDVNYAAARISRFLDLPYTYGTFEVQQWATLIEDGRFLVERILDAHKGGKRVDAHTAGASYEKLNPILAAGLDSCHEPIDAQQALDRLRLGMYVFLRGSSLREDLSELLRVVTENRVDTGRLALTTDGSSPAYIADRGSVEHLADLAVEAGVDPMTALQMISLNPATYFHLDQFLGGIAPGRMADIAINPRPDRFKPDMVIASGRVAAREGRVVMDFPAIDWDQYDFDRPMLPHGTRIKPEDVMVRAEEVAPTYPMMDLVMAAITRRHDVELPVTDGFVDLSRSEGLVYASLLDRHGEWATNGIIKGFAADVQGLATSYTPTSCVIVLGRSADAMTLAANRLYEIGGGLILAENDRIIFELPLEIGGAMSKQTFDVVVDRTRELANLLRERGYCHEEFLYTTLFLNCNFLPEIRLTFDGLYDVKNRQVLRPRRMQVPACQPGSPKTNSIPSARKASTTA
ncbi:MAG: amidohydrolase family protein [Chloroflexi bacterium]|nr:amidohydrolase family protein [Chloroflexota bacterium]